MSVGYKLYREVRDYAPRDWSPSELVVAWVIADDANDDTRVSWIALPVLCAHARLSERGVRDVLHRLGDGGYEFRVVHGYGKDGRPVYAAKGHAVDYLVPDMLKGGTLMPSMAVDNKSPAVGKPASTVDNPDPRRHDGAATGTPKAARFRRKGGTDPFKGGTVVPPLSSSLLTIPSDPSAVDLCVTLESAHAGVGQEQFSDSAAGDQEAPASRRPGPHAAPAERAEREQAHLESEAS